MFAILLISILNTTYQCMYQYVRGYVFYMQDGVWIKGLFLEGAGWDKRTSCLVDSRAMELVHPMPTIHFRPVEGKRRSTKGWFDATKSIFVW